MKPQCSLARARFALCLSFLLCGSLPLSLHAFRPQAPSTLSPEDRDPQPARPAPSAPVRPEAQPKPEAPAPRPRSDPPGNRHNETRPAQNTDSRPSSRPELTPEPRRDTRPTDSAPLRPNPSSERRWTPPSRNSNDTAQRPPESTPAKAPRNEHNRNQYNPSNSEPEDRPQRTQRPRDIESPSSAQPTPPAPRPTQGTQAGKPHRDTPSSEPAHKKPADSKQHRADQRDRDKTRPSLGTPHENTIHRGHDREDKHRPGSNGWHTNKFPVRPLIVIPNHDNTHRYDRHERWHDRNRIWSGYNHESRRSWGLHFYDPFYYEWVFCGGVYYYWRGTRHSAYRPYYAWDYDYTPEPYSVSEAHYPSANPICFPPSFPPLGTPPPAREINPGAGAPGALLAYLNEPFYAALSTRLLQNSLLQDQKLALYQYRDQRDSELALLQRELDLATGEAPERAQAHLQAFAEQQTPRLRALEAKAEELRSDFIRKGLSGLLLGSGNWNERREYYLNLGEGGDSESERTRLDFLLLRAAVYYQDGLSRTQRDLLREAASELQLQSYITRGGIENEAERNQYLHFSPGGVQIPIGPNMPTHLVNMLQIYTDRKTELKDQLIAQLYSLEATSDRRRRDTLSSFARAQEHNYLFLENLAEQIRVELARYPQALELHTRSSLLPQALLTRIDTLADQRLALAQEYEQQFQLFNQSASPAQVRVLNLHVEDPDPDEPPQLTLGSAPRMPETQREELRERLRLFNESNARRHAILRSEQTAILIEIENLLRRSAAMAEGRTAAEILESQLVQSRARELTDRYREYRLAALQPGLSIEQRRLLLGSALTHVGMPLPPAE